MERTAFHRSVLDALDASGVPVLIGGSHALTFDVSALGGDDRDLEEQCFIPGLQRVGGLRTVQRLVARSDSWSRSSSGQGSLR